MVVNVTRNNNQYKGDDDDAATVDSRASGAKPAPTTEPTFDMEDKIAEVKQYFATLDGSKDAWTRFEPRFNALIHPNLIIEIGDDGQDAMSYEELKIICRDKLIPNGCGVVLLDVRDNGDGTITYVKKNIVPGEEKDGQETAQRAHFSPDGKILRITTSKELGNVLDKVLAMD